MQIQFFGTVPPGCLIMTEGVGGGGGGGVVLDWRFLAVSLPVSAPRCVTLALFQGTIRTPWKSWRMRCQDDSVLLPEWPGWFFSTFSLAFRGEGGEGHFACYMSPAAASVHLPQLVRTMGGRRCWWTGGAVGGGVTDSSYNTARPNPAQADVPIIKAQLNSLLPSVGPFEGWGEAGVGGLGHPLTASQQSSIRLDSAVQMFITE